MGEKNCFIAALIFLSLLFHFGVAISHSTASDFFNEDNYADNVVGIAYNAADMLENNLLSGLNRTLPILATSFVNLDNLKSSSTLGRLLGEYIASRFSQHGYQVIELRLQKDCLLVQEGNGELALSRDKGKIGTSYDAQAIIIGTYSLADDLLFVSTRIVSTVDHSILSSYDFSLRLDKTLRILAENGVTTAVKNVSGNGSRSGIKESPKTGAQKGILSGGLVLLDTSVSLGAKIIQARLAQLGYYSDKIDGVWKKHSLKALKNFKKNRGLTDNDKWGPATQKALFAGTDQ